MQDHNAGLECDQSNISNDSSSSLDNEIFLNRLDKLGFLNDESIFGTKKQHQDKLPTFNTVTNIRKDSSSTSTYKDSNKNVKLVTDYQNNLFHQSCSNLTSNNNTNQQQINSNIPYYGMNTNYSTSQFGSYINPLDSQSFYPYPYYCLPNNISSCYQTPYVSYCYQPPYSQSFYPYTNITTTTKSTKTKKIPSTKKISIKKLNQESSEDSVKSQTKNSKDAPVKQSKQNFLTLDDILSNKNLTLYINSLKGSKKMQKILEDLHPNSIEIQNIFKLILPNLGKITNHNFGNYFIQKLVKKLTFSQRKRLGSFISIEVF